MISVGSSTSESRGLTSQSRRLPVGPPLLSAPHHHVDLLVPSLGGRARRIRATGRAGRWTSARTPPPRRLRPQRAARVAGRLGGPGSCGRRRCVQGQADEACRLSENVLEREHRAPRSAEEVDPVKAESVANGLSSSRKSSSVQRSGSSGRSETTRNRAGRRERRAPAPAAPAARSSDASSQVPRGDRAAARRLRDRRRGTRSRSRGTGSDPRRPSQDQRLEYGRIAIGAGTASAGSPGTSGRSAAFRSNGIRSGPRRCPRIPREQSSSPNESTGSATDSRPSDDERNRIARVDHVGIGRRRMVTGDADNRPFSR